MTRTYTIHLSPYTISILNSPNYKKIPNHASTQYAHTIYPLTENAPKPVSIPVRHPMGNTRKIIAHTDRPAIDAPIAITPTTKTYQPKHRSKYRNNVNKAALAQYFDNTPSASEQWMADVISELETHDTNRASTINADNESLRQFVETSRAPNFADDPIYHTNQVYVFVINLSDVLPILLDALIMANATNHKTKQKPYALSAVRPEINAHIADHFIKKHHGADTAAAMRALDKQSRHKPKIPYILHQLQITK
ncbi:MAG: hypothetical protein NC311_02815 [Muribaculaceae bacterium]|nr:hypothetical protein [Muribaculaceae bacterium]